MLRSIEAPYFTSFGEEFANFSCQILKFFAEAKNIGRYFAKKIPKATNETAVQTINQAVELSIDKPDDELTLSERIAKYGKLRFIFVCDENLGRSVMFKFALEKRLQITGLEGFVEVLCAGTDVKVKNSDKKYKGAHPAVMKEMLRAGIDTSSHKATQFDVSLLNPNTILVILNDINKMPSDIRERCFVVLDCGMDDPHEDPQNVLNNNYVLHDFDGRITRLHEHAHYFSLELILWLKKALRLDDLSGFKQMEKKKIDLNDYLFTL